MVGAAWHPRSPKTCEPPLGSLPPTEGCNQVGNDGIKWQALYRASLSAFEGLRSDDTQVRRFAPGERDGVTPINPDTSRAAQKRYDHGPAILRLSGPDKD